MSEFKSTEHTLSHLQFVHDLIPEGGKLSTSNGEDTVTSLIFNPETVEIILVQTLHGEHSTIKLSLNDVMNLGDDLVRQIMILGAANCAECGKEIGHDHNEQDD